MTLAEVAAPAQEEGHTLPAFVDALDRLERLDPRLAEVVKLRLV